MNNDRAMKVLSVAAVVALIAVLVTSKSSSAKAEWGHREWTGNPAPTLTASGEVLSWTRVRWSNYYEILRNIPGQRSQIFFVWGTTVKADGIKCTTLGYKIRAAIWGSWSNEVKITYPCPEEKTEKHEETHEEEHKGGNEEEKIREEAEKAERERVQHEKEEHEAQEKSQKEVKEHAEEAAKHKAEEEAAKRKAEEEKVKEQQEKEEREAREAKEREEREKPVEEKAGVFISPTGKDSNACTSSAPCLTMNRGYEKAAGGETVWMLAGSYGSQTIEAASKSSRVNFTAAPGANVKVTATINVFSSHVEISGISVQDVTIGNYDETPGRPNASDVYLLNLTGRNFQIDSASNVTVEGGSWGPASACGGPSGGNNNSIREPVPGVAPENVLIKNTTIHDVQSYNLTNCHIEGLAIFAGTNVTVEGSHFYGNSIYDIFIQANSGGSPNKVSILNNWMADAIDNSGANGHAAGYHNGIAFGSEIASNLTLEGNHMNGVVNINDDGSIKNFTNVIMKEDVGKMAYNGYPCVTELKGTAFTKNIWQNDKCSSSDANLEGAPIPYVNASDDSTLDYTLTGKYAHWPEEEKTASVAFRPGADQGTEPLDFKLDNTLKPKMARIEFSANEGGLVSHVESVDEELHAKGVELQPLIGFAGRMLSSSEAKAAGQIPCVDPRISKIELGNETSYGYQYGDGYTAASYKERARIYAGRVKEAAEAAKPCGAGVEAQAEDGGSGSATWVNEMFAAVPNLSSYVAAWVIHPYSAQKSASESDSSGIPKMERMVRNLAEHGDAKTPIAVTEWGEPSENGTTLSDGKHLTFKEAAQIAETQIPKLRAAAKEHQITTFVVYQIHDQRAQGTDTEREHYFGVYTSKGEAKSPYTSAIERLMAE